MRKALSGTRFEGNGYVSLCTSFVWIQGHILLQMLQGSCAMSQANPIVRASMQGSPRRRRNRSNEIDELCAYIRGPLLAFPAYGKRLLQLARIVTVSNMPSAEAPSIPQTQTAALVRELGGKIEFRTDYPVPKPGVNEVLVKVLYTG